MTHEEYLAIKDREPEENNSCDIIESLSDKTARTLLYGYTVERYSFHVYLANGTVVRYIYKDTPHQETMIMATVSPVHDLSTLVPDKRVYPETCDIEFCRLLLRHGVQIPFTVWTDRPPSQFYGALFKVSES